ncbi:cell division protein ZapE [Rhodococcus sp. 14-2470-1b]|jgi:cell division protein ZapE|uniref:cell division protein ZapE n=1 Tax=Rhodococcus sp. 14-2470-1b TaxID=2023149 RepID=UPI0020CB7146|nr:cell division protein ZapE [Rhodococcus sp. 14-2470-1b]
MRPPVSRDAFAADFELDPSQRSAVDILTRAEELGLYLWGPVGRGKTWLLDKYFDAAPEPKKRFHFHTFFRDLHASYFVHRFQLEPTLDALLGRTRLLCFDEFHVHDIGDARLIARMLDALVTQGVALVATSNYPPDGLLPNPLFHDAFVPTIEVLKANLRVVCVDGPVDYRTLGDAVPKSSGFTAGSWSITESAAGESFVDLCEAPRSTGDYLAVVDRLDAGAELTITQIPALADASDDAVRRFSNLVDILYDADIRTRFQARVPLEKFADGRRETFGLIPSGSIDLERTLSRLSQLRHSGASNVAEPRSKGDAHS